MLLRPPPKKGCTQAFAFFVIFWGGMFFCFFLASTNKELKTPKKLFYRDF